jgi:hypothetical protein
MCAVTPVPYGTLFGVTLSQATIAPLLRDNSQQALAMRLVSRVSLTTDNLLIVLVIVFALVLDLEILAWCLNFDNEHENENDLSQQIRPSRFS